VSRVFGLVFLAVLSIGAAFAVPPSKTTPAHKAAQVSAHPAAKIPAVSHAIPRYSGSTLAKTQTAAKAPANTGLRLRTVSTRTISSRTAHGKTIRGSHIVARAAVPSFQSHPDEDRYREIQQALTEKGYFKGEVNGQWGDDSVTALQKFQLDNKLPDIYTDGKINSLSLIGLGLGPKHGDHASEQLPAAPASMPIPSAPTELGPAVSTTSSVLPPPQSN
jgi:hypothetical protein